MDDNKKMNFDLYRGVTVEQHDTMDYRHPEMYRDSVTEATKVAIQWFETYSQRNSDGMKEVMRFPLIHADENTVNKINKSEDLVKSPTPFMNVRAIAEKDYDALE